MTRLGLALSGGGLRATLYHLGVVRCLKDAGTLPKITHITAVSGGSIFAAHLGLNWDRYCGSGRDFDEAAEEIIRFAQLDVRNRIVRRFPFTETANLARSMLLMKTRRQWTRPGLLERYYERMLYGDTPLSQLPDHPQLHLLSTNLSEGCLCSFNREGMYVQRRVGKRRDRFEKVEASLATVPMAVAASSCFPGFFPPLELTGVDVGADQGEFVRQAFTDGGVYDNLALRMFRYLEQSWLQHRVILQKNDLLAHDEVMSALQTANELPEDSPLRRLRKLIDGYVSSSENVQGRQFSGAMLIGLREVIRSEKLYRDPAFQMLELEDAAAKSLLDYAVNFGREPGTDDSLQLNRVMVDSALRQQIGKPCLRKLQTTFDGILVSDAGGKLKVNRDKGGGSLISTALRSSDILMDRVWQLESEVFQNTPGVVFIPITDVVDREKDPGALEPQVQRQLPRIRTDLDCFSDLEISLLAQHGYSVARMVLRRNDSWINGSMPDDPPWDPISDDGDTTRQLTDVPSGSEFTALGIARQLQNSSKRKVVRTLLSLRDWPSYVWLLMLLSLVAGAAVFVARRSERLEQQEIVLSAVAQLNPDYQTIVDLLQNQVMPEIQPMEFETVVTMEDSEMDGFEIISESRVFDLRNWNESTPKSEVYGFARTRIQRLKDGGNSKNTELTLNRDLASDQYLVECKSETLHPRLLRMELGDGLYRWQMRFDLSRVPLGSDVDVVNRFILAPEMAKLYSAEGRFNFNVRLKTGLLQVWLLMPEDRQYGMFEVSSHPVGQPELTEIVVPAAVVRVALGSVASFRLINPDPDRCYECRWTWNRPGERP